MNKTFQSGLSLHAVINDAPLPLVAQFLTSMLPDYQLPTIADANEPAGRDQLLDAVRDLPRHDARRLDSVAGRLLGLAAGREADTLLRVLTSRLSGTEASDLREGLDELGRSLWTYLNREQLFEDAESLAHALTFRDYPPIFASFDAPAGKDLSWNDELAARLKKRIVEGLALEGPVRLSHLTIDEDDADSRSHVVIVRHGDVLTSVAEHRQDGGRKWHYYSPSHEITLIYTPTRGIVEVCAKSPSLRQDAAVVFAETGLEQDLSAKPLSFKLYNLSRFRKSLSLPFFEPDGFKLEAVGVVEVETHPYDPAHRLSLKVTAADDIDAVAGRLFGASNIFRRSPITRVVIAVQYWPTKGRGRTRTLRIALWHPNRCDLRSERDPELRRLGYDLLEHWGILKSLRTPTPQDERALLPALLEVYDLGAPTMTERDLHERGFDVEALSGHGFIEPAGRFQGVLIDEDDRGPELVEVRSGLGDMVEFDDAAGRPAWVPKALVTKFKINHEWVEEVLLRQLKAHLATSAMVPQIEGLTLLGELDLGAEKVPCFLARGLSGFKRLRRVDSHLRGQANAGVGLILDAGRDAPECLGANVVVSLRDFLNADGSRPAIEIDGLRMAFVQGKTRARGGMVVDFVKGNDGYTGVLSVPGKDSLLVAGADQVKIVERLVAACRDGSRVVRTGDLMAGTGSTAPSQAFPNWKGTAERYIGSPKRGYWQLLV